jgi:hypothetical protein
MRILLRHAVTLVVVGLGTSSVFAAYSPRSRSFLSSSGVNVT